MLSFADICCLIDNKIIPIMKEKRVFGATIVELVNIVDEISWIIITFLYEKS